MAATAVRSEEENLHYPWSGLQFRSDQQVNNVGGCYGLKGSFQFVEPLISKLTVSIHIS